jgi:hypothetical protein
MRLRDVRFFIVRHRRLECNVIYHEKPVISVEDSAGAAGLQARDDGKKSPLE